MKPLLNGYNWKERNFSSEKVNWKKTEKNNVTIVLMFCILKKKKYTLPMFQKITQIVKKVIILMIPNRERWHYLAIKKLSALLREITSKYHGDFYCLNCFHSFTTENKH